MRSECRFRMRKTATQFPHLQTHQHWWKRYHPLAARFAPQIVKSRTKPRNVCSFDNDKQNSQNDGYYLPENPRTHTSGIPTCPPFLMIVLPFLRVSKVAFLSFACRHLRERAWCRSRGFSFCDLLLNRHSNQRHVGSIKPVIFVILRYPFQNLPFAFFVD